ncbi:MAG: hypothetical protein KatS3mg065_0869 [Chloroflexota bacterium]|nr:MAG: hypothetical protein KatS3mg065_0869 [Chloroflexota bacterium]
MAAAGFPDPAYPDSFYYVDAARAIADGRGLTVDFVWIFAEVGGRVPAEPTLPIPAFGHWMPLAALVQVPFLWLLGPVARRLGRPVRPRRRPRRSPDLGHRPRRRASGPRSGRGRRHRRRAGPPPPLPRPARQLRPLRADRRRLRSGRPRAPSGAAAGPSWRRVSSPASPSCRGSMAGSSSVSSACAIVWDRLRARTPEGPRLRIGVAGDRRRRPRPRPRRRAVVRSASWRPSGRPRPPRHRAKALFIRDMSEWNSIHPGRPSTISSAWAPAPSSPAELLGLVWAGGSFAIVVGGDRPHHLGLVMGPGGGGARCSSGPS